MQSCFTATETLRTISDREPRRAASTFTQLLSSGDFLFEGGCRKLIIHFLRRRQRNLEPFLFFLFFLQSPFQAEFASCGLQAREGSFHSGLGMGWGCWVGGWGGGGGWGVGGGG